MNENGRDTPNGHEAAHSATMPIAVVGMSCRFGGGLTSPEQLWDRVSHGENSWSPTPRDRFDLQGFYHPEAQHNDSTHIKGGYFLDEDVSLFDHSFFNITAPVASALDPQIRIMLELTYEAFERAGITLDDIAGTRTSVYTGTFTRDYCDQLVSDPLHVPSALIVGNYAAMTANRLSHFFNLKGTSLALDTGCSGSMVGVHLATQSLRSGESDCAVVAGSAINLNAESFITTANVGTCGPDGKCYSFDHRAQGYGRGEGVAVVVLKRLDEALKAGDPVQAIIRETASNQDGRTSTITSPDANAQYELIRECYKQAGLDPLHTPVVEAHGTGTKAGDPVEAQAIGRALRPLSARKQTSSSPVLMGSVKTNIGHTEAVSGLASLIKMAKSLQEGKVAPSINFEKPNESIDFDDLGIKIARNLEDWPAGETRRASINNFGYGGTNVHVILDAPASARPGSAANGAALTASSKHLANEESVVNGELVAQDSAKGSKLLLLSAREEDTVRAMCTNLHAYLQRNPHTSFDDLIYTCGQRRTRFPWNIAVPARSCKDLCESLADEQAIKPKRSLNHSPTVAFVFNGQGSQHFAMGRELVDAYPVYRDHLEKCDEAIRSFGSEWSILTELKRGENDTKVNQVRYSMPLTCALQISLVALLADWNIKPAAVVGHSSGEIAAAYASGAITLTEAMAASYFRGLVNAEHVAGQKTSSGGMLAVGLGPEQAELYLQGEVPGQATVACYNSPESVTLSGDMETIEHVEAQIKAAGSFARKLKVEAAFHSHHMEPLADRYERLLNESMSTGQDRKFTEGVKYYSAVPGAALTSAEDLGPPLWVANMLQPVRFSQAFDDMIRDEPHVDCVVEIGPHSALSGPLRQCLAQPDLKGRNVTYGSCLERRKSAVETMQDLASMLVQLGCPLNVVGVNFPSEVNTPATIPDLPTYPWNHNTKLWIEGRPANDRRFRPFPQHDLLGIRMYGLSNANATMLWRHVIRPTEIPWVRDHVVQSQIVYPGAGYIAMAIEAARQMHWAQRESIRGYSLRDVEIVKALIIPDNADGAEVQLALEGVEERLLTGAWRRFRISSPAGKVGDPWVAIATGLIQVQIQQDSGSPTYQLRRSQDVVRAMEGLKQGRGMPAKSLFETLRTYGVQHGPVFRNLRDDAMGAEGRACVSYDIADTAAAMPQGYQEPHVLHPTTLDSLFVATFFSFQSLNTSSRSGAHVPRSIKQIFVSAAIHNAPGTQILAQTLLRRTNNQGITVSAVAEAPGTAGRRPVIEIDDLFLQHIGHSDATSDSSGSNDGPSSATSDMSHLCLVTEWRRSFGLNKSESVVDAIRMHASEEECRQSQDLIRATFYVVADALRQLTEEDVANLEPHHEKYLAWMRRLVADAAAGRLGKGSADWTATKPGLKQRLIDNVAGRGPAGELAMRVGQNILGILRKEVAPLELMLEQKLLNSFYRDAVQMARTAQSTAHFVRAIADEMPCARILEIGAGTAGYTVPVLQKLTDSTTSAQLFAHYTFTDISAGFFASAREELAPWGRHVSYATLDIEKDLSEQGFELGSYDIIIAGQVLHATTNLVRTMTNVRSLLKENGKLVMAETTRDAIEVSLIFGALPGWWLSEEPERWNGPNLPLESWDSYLKAVGFTGIDVSVGDCEEDHQCHMSTFVTTARSHAEPLLEKTATLIYSQARPPARYLDTLKDRFFGELGVTLTIQSLSSVKTVAGGTYILLFDEVASSQEFDEPTFESIKDIITTCQGLMCVTAGSAVAAEMPENSIHQGLLRTARSEDTNKRFVSLDLDPEIERFSPANVEAMIKIFRRTMDGHVAADTDLDQEYAIRESTILVPRIAQDHDEFNALSSLLVEPEAAPHKFLQDNADGHHVRLAVDTPGLIDSLVFREDLEASQPLKEDIVEVQPLAFGLNFKDVMEIMGLLDDPYQSIGCECAGIVSRIGPNCENQDLKVGDRVLALTPRGQIATTARTPSTSVIRIPDSLTFERAATLPVVFATAWYSLFEIGRCQPEDSVLIHAAAGGVGQACIILAQLRGITNLFVTVGTPEKREFLRATYGIPSERMFSSRDASFVHGILDATHGRGVDVIINSLSGNLLAESFGLLAPHGRFVEIGKRDIVTNHALDMQAFRRALSFTHVDVQQMSYNRGKHLQRILKEVIQLLSTGQIQCITPINQYSVADLPRALRTMQSGQHMGKIVIVPTTSDLVKTVAPPPRAKLRPDASYLVVGGASGIGIAVAQRLILRGARHLLLVSRTATSRGVQLEGDAKVVVRDCDVSDGVALRKMLQDCYSDGLPPVKGVIYGGMVLEDAIFVRMTFAQWNNALKPKLNGLRNVHNFFGDSLEFLVMLSSASGILGMPSQSNYASGNAYLDALARHRTARGLPAVTIDLGLIKSIGNVAEDDFDETEKRVLKATGHRAMTEAEVLALVEAAILRPFRTVRTSQIVTGITGSGTTAQRDPRYTPLRQLVIQNQQLGASTAQSNSAGSTKHLSEQIAGAESAEEATGLVTAALIAKVSDMFGRPEADTDASSSLKDFGVDSLVAVELRNWLISSARADISIFQLLESSSLKDVAATVVGLAKPAV